MKAQYVSMPSGQLFDTARVEIIHARAEGTDSVFFLTYTKTFMTRDSSFVYDTNGYPEWRFIVARQDTYQVANFTSRASGKNRLTGCTKGCPTPGTHTVNGQIREGQYIDLK